MASRFRREQDPPADGGARSATETKGLDRDDRFGRDDERTAVDDRARNGDRGVDGDRVVERDTRAGAPVSADTMAAVRARQRDEFGGFAWGSTFFGWLTAVGMAAILAGIASAAGAALALGENVSGGDAETIGLVGGIVLLVLLAVAYFCGGYVAGRLARFDGARQGLGVVLWSLVVGIALALLAAVGGSEYNVFGELNLPRIPVDEGTLTTGGIIALAAALLTMLVAAILGGKAGERFHRKVDRTATDGRL